MYIPNAVLIWEVYIQSMVHALIMACPTYNYTHTPITIVIKSTHTTLKCVKQKEYTAISITFIHHIKLCSSVHTTHPGQHVIAEESFPMRHYSHHECQ